MVPIIEGFRFALYHEGLVTKSQLATSFLVCTTIFFVGIIMFNRVEQTVMDTV
jgi:ABC-type polysaccharide/polyol phosphate export permease